MSLMTQPDYDLKWREDAEIHERHEQLETESFEWFLKIYSADDRLTKAYKKQRLSEFTSRCHLNCVSYERMLVMSKAYLIFTLWDDLFVDKPHTWDNVATSAMDIATNNKFERSDSDNYLLNAWYDVWQEIVSLSPKQWQEHFALSLQHWFASSRIENSIRVSKRILNYTEYHPLRLVSILVDNSFDFIEFAQNEYLTAEERANPTFQLLYIHAKTAVYLTNDLYSWPKEKRIGDNMNVISIHLLLAKLSEDEAIGAVVQKIQEQIDSMDGIMDNYRSLMSPGHDFYLTALSRHVRGNYDFHISCKRYS